jgi:hypothetical protein
MVPQISRDFSQHVVWLTDDELVDVFRQSYDPVPELLEAARIEIRKRGLPEPPNPTQIAPQKAPSQTFEVLLPGDELKAYLNSADLQAGLARGELNRCYPCRIVAASGNSEQAARKEPWTTIEDLANKVGELNRVLRPKTYYMQKFMIYGAVAGIALKLLDTTIILGALAISWLGGGCLRSVVLLRRGGLSSTQYWYIHF